MIDLPDLPDWDDSFLEQVEPPTGRQLRGIQLLCAELGIPEPKVRGIEEAEAMLVDLREQCWEVLKKEFSKLFSRQVDRQAGERHDS